MNSIDKINRDLREWNYSFRAIEKMGMLPIGMDSIFVTKVVTIELGEVWLDSDLNRYFRATNGQFYLCSNADLTGKTDSEKQSLVMELAGMEIF